MGINIGTYDDGSICGIALYILGDVFDKNF